MRAASRFGGTSVGCDAGAYASDGFDVVEHASARWSDRPAPAPRRRRRRAECLDKVTAEAAGGAIAAGQRKFRDQDVPSAVDLYLTRALQPQLASELQRRVTAHQLEGAQQAARTGAGYRGSSSTRRGFSQFASI